MEPSSSNQSLSQQALLRLRKNTIAMWGGYFLLGIVLLCFCAPLLPIIPNPNYQEVNSITAPPNIEHWLGTDHLGRDLFSRLLYGGRISLLVGLVATVVSLIIGMIYGAISGYAGGRIDALMMRGIDILFALPFLVLVIIFSLRIESTAAALTQWIVRHSWFSTETIAPITNLIPLFIAIGALSWLTLARIVRTEVISLKERDFVQAARSLGLTHSKLLTHHILPNLIGPVIIYTTLSVPGIMLLESILSFLGLGVRPPSSSWGTLIKEGADRMEVSLPLLLYPALFFSFTLLALNFLGDGLRDAFDPKK